MSKPFYVDTHGMAFGGFQKDFSEADFILFGVPFDGTTSYKPGSRFAPRALREAAANLETWSWRTGVDFEEVKIHDLGDLAVVHGDASETVRRVEETVEDIKSAKKIPVMLGGEHLVTLGAVRALKDAAVVSFDAHYDMRDDYLSNRLSHACVMRRISEECGAAKVILVGARATYREEVDYIRSAKVQYLTSLDIIRNGAEAAVSWLQERVDGAKKIYISIDADVLDPSCAPGVGNPEPEGISMTQLLDILNGIVDNRTAGFDLVEVSPPYDTGITAAAGAKIVFEACSMISRSRSGMH